VSVLHHGDVDFSVAIKIPEGHRSRIPLVGRRIKYRRLIAPVWVGKSNVEPIHGRIQLNAGTDNVEKTIAIQISLRSGSTDVGGLTAAKCDGLGKGGG